MNSTPVESAPPVERREEVDHPKHYNASPSGIECIEVVEHLSFNLGNAVKYLWRAGLKPDVKAETDLRKGAWYIEREISRLRAWAASGEKAKLDDAPKEPSAPYPPGRTSTFSEALSRMRMGGAFKRQGWPSTMPCVVWWRLSGGTEMLMITGPDDSVNLWTPNREDIVAHDWVWVQRAP